MEQQVNIVPNDNKKEKKPSFFRFVAKNWLLYIITAILVTAAVCFGYFMYPFMSNKQEALGYIFCALFVICGIASFITLILLINKAEKNGSFKFNYSRLLTAMSFVVISCVITTVTLLILSKNEAYNYLMVCGLYGTISLILYLLLLFLISYSGSIFQYLKTIKKHQ